MRKLETLNDAKKKGNGLPEVEQVSWCAAVALYRHRGRRDPTALVHEMEEGEHQQGGLEANSKDMTFKVEAHQNRR